MYYNILKLYSSFNRINNRTFNRKRIIRNLKRQFIQKTIMNLRKL